LEPYFGERVAFEPYALAVDGTKLLVTYEKEVVPVRAAVGGVIYFETIEQGEIIAVIEPETPTAA